jgi:hypothetical protein
MDRNSFNRGRWMLWITLAILALGLLNFALQKSGVTKKPTATAAGGEEKKTAPAAVAFRDNQPPAGDKLPLKINPDTILGLVNGHALTAAEVLPPGSFKQPVSLDVCQYFLQRAVDRELILQTAKAQGRALDASQRQQMTDFQTTREQHGPGLVRDLNGGAGEISFEMRDAEAFMLQTSLMEKLGASPNVTSQQVQAYYREHASQFGELPADESGRKEAWSKIDYQIRQLLASSVRSDFQQKLADYMKNLKTAANIELTPLASLTSN